MQSIIIEKPYKFIPPMKGTWLPWLMQRLGLVDLYLKKCEGIREHEVRGIEHLRTSVERGDGILLAPNHCRYADPIVMAFLARELNIYPLAMASWHLFHQSRVQSLAMRILGAFSIYREGSDRQSLDTAIDILADAKRPLLIFPEGAVFRTNDRLQELLDGVSLITRAAAKKRIKSDPNAKVVVHPIAIKYLPLEAVDKMVEPMLVEIEQRLTWRPAPSSKSSLLDRVQKATQAMLCLKEVEYFGTPQTGTWLHRQSKLVDRLLNPLEQSYLGKLGEASIINRVKALRTKIVPELLAAKNDETVRQRLWAELEEIYLAQQVASYPPDYLSENATEARLLETVERLSEDLTDKSRVFGPLKVVLEIGPAIEVSDQRARGGDTPDLMAQLRSSLTSMLDGLAKLSNSIPSTANDVHNDSAETATVVGVATD